MPILVLSYPWLDRHHPDKHGATLRRILPILRACREQALKPPHGGDRGGGVHCTFGVFWDYMSLPQGADRSEAEYARFKQGLATMAACAAPRAPRTRASAHPARLAPAAFTCTRTFSC